jgi:hypothetical protein
MDGWVGGRMMYMYAWHRNGFSWRMDFIEIINIYFFISNIFCFFASFIFQAIYIKTLLFHFCKWLVLVVKVLYVIELINIRPLFSNNYFILKTAMSLLVFIQLFIYCVSTSCFVSGDCRGCFSTFVFCGALYILQIERLHRFHWTDGGNLFALSLV